MFCSTGSWWRSPFSADGYNFIPKKSCPRAYLWGRKLLGHGCFAPKWRSSALLRCLGECGPLCLPCCQGLLWSRCFSAGLLNCWAFAPDYAPRFMFAKRYAPNQHMCQAIRTGGGHNNRRSHSSWRNIAISPATRCECNRLISTVVLEIPSSPV